MYVQKIFEKWIFFSGKSVNSLEPNAPVEFESLSQKFVAS